ncbi:hypothetical protein EYF80_049142 [Liparis tanakae]|uniref:Uncharacterized protein n=1 Tax=Liparis tanakae TaxID=230148 RepID=A0A4Z2FID4_9TELE|nr:hypothetical protein EYF80_049142 [Liparis tanakae]
MKFPLKLTAERRRLGAALLARRPDLARDIFRIISCIHDIKGGLLLLGNTLIMSFTDADERFIRDM